MLIDFFSCANTILGRLPVKDVKLISWNSGSRGDVLDSLGVKGTIQELQIPGMGIRKPKIRGSSRKGGSSDRQKKVVMDGFSEREPRSRPNRGIVCMELELSIV